MKKTIIFAAFAALFLASSCSERVDIPEVLGENVISLDLVYGDPATRADETTPGEGLENAVTSVQYFFYNDVTADPIFNSGRIENPTITEDLKYKVKLVAGEGGVPDLTTMFKNTECIVFAVFNMPSAIDAAPLATVKAIALTKKKIGTVTEDDGTQRDIFSAPFAHQDGVNGDSSGSDWVVTTDAEAVDYDKYFVMTGELTLTRAKNASYAAKGTVEMNRVAAKIAIDLKIKKTVTVGEGTAAEDWIPMLGGKQIRVYPNFVAANAVLGGASATPTYPTDLGQFTYKEIVYTSYYPEDYQTGGSLAGQTDPGKVVISEDGNYYEIASQQDFYTYPISWTRGTDVEPFIKVIVPWRGKNGTTSQKEIYYKVMLPMEKIEANKYYKLTVNVSILGTEGEPEVTLKPLSAEVVSWQGGAPVNGTISAAKYLSVDRGVVTATTNYDTAEGRFDFYTPTSGTDFAASDPVTVTIKEIKQKNLTTGNWEYLYENFSANTTQIQKRGFSQEQVDSDWIKFVGDNYLQIGHQLNSDLTSVLMDVTPYYYTVVLSLPADIDPRTTQYPYGEYAKTVTFVQWPEVYVEEDPNSNGGTATNYGVFVNGSNSEGAVYTYENQTLYPVNDPNVFAHGYAYDYEYRVYSSNYGNNYTTETRTGYYNGYQGNYNNYYIAEYGGAYHLGGANGISSSALNKNPNMYILTISVSDKYIIGDPRTPSVDTDFIDGFYRASGDQAYDRNRTSGRSAVTYRYYYNNYNYTNLSVYTSRTSNWVSAPRTYDSSNGILSNYHPAFDNNTDNMIAPKIRVASSYGVCITGRTREEAEYRCASYQEDGIPAGRWRLPTFAEVEFIGTLSSLGRIPYLFGSIVRDDDGEPILDENGNQQGLDDDSYYWTANGLIRINNGQNITESATSDPDHAESVRCVYDEWFWGDATTRPVAKGTFTWGDRNY